MAIRVDYLSIQERDLEGKSLTQDENRRVRVKVVPGRPELLELDTDGDRVFVEAEELIDAIDWARYIDLSGEGDD